MTRRCPQQWLNEPTERQLEEERQRLAEWREAAEPVGSWFFPQVDDQRPAHD